MGNLTERQKRFIDYYIETGNSTEACRRAGYKGKNLDNIGSENLRKLGSYIQEKLKTKANERIASQDEVLEYLTNVMRNNIVGASVTDRTKCAELLGKRYCLFTDKKEVSASIIPVVISGDDMLEE